MGEIVEYRDGKSRDVKINRKQRAIDYFLEQRGRCAYCFNQMPLELNKPNTAEVEHIVPKSYRRIPGHFNEVAACSTCNREKADKPLREFLSGLIERKFG